MSGMYSEDTPTRAEVEDDEAMDLIDWARDNAPELLLEYEDAVYEAWVGILNAIRNAKYTTWAVAHSRTSDIDSEEPF